MITYLSGDATQPQTKGPAVIAHVCNSLGGWGRGFVLSLSDRWAAPEAAYRRWHRDRVCSKDGVGYVPFALGQIQVVPVGGGLVVCNMVAQAGYTRRESEPSIRYDCLEQCLNSVERMVAASGIPYSVHMPRIGCGLGGSNWGMIEPIVERSLTDKGVPTYVYDFEIR